MNTRTLWFALMAIAACGRAPTDRAPSNRAPTVVAVDAMEPATTRGSNGRCVPEPREGAPCTKPDSWCVISWGEPGGFSVAMWCRNGRWEREQEVNLP